MELLNKYIVQISMQSIQARVACWTQDPGRRSSPASSGRGSPALGASSPGGGALFLSGSLQPQVPLQPMLHSQTELGTVAVI